jgi:hypothetical protein
MDPIGLSFENFDAIGRWRDKYDEDISIDVGGMLPDGFVLGSVSDLQNYLLSNKTDFEINLIKKLMIYSFGRGLEDGDYKTLHEIYQKTATQDCRLEDIITEIVLSKAFMYKS